MRIATFILSVGTEQGFFHEFASVSKVLKHSLNFENIRCSNVVEVQMRTLSQPYFEILIFHTDCVSYNNYTIDGYCGSSYTDSTIDDDDAIRRCQNLSDLVCSIQVQW